MSESTSINECQNCDQAYCINCSNAEDFAHFCSKACQKEWENEEQRT